MSQLQHEKQITIGELETMCELLRQDFDADSDTPVVFYHLDNYLACMVSANLEGQEIESVLPFHEADNDEGRQRWVEITLKAIGTDEGGE